MKSANGSGTTIDAAIEAVVFDLGNTLWFYTGRHDPAVVHARQAAALEPLLRDWGLRVPGSLPELLREIWDAYETAWQIESGRGGVREPDRARIVQGGLATRGVEITGEQAERWWRTAWVASRYFGVELYPDTLDVLRDLHTRGLRIAINSNRPCTGDMMRPDFEDFGMAPYIDAVVCSGDTGFAKPHPSTFERALSLLGAPAERTVMVGDSCERDCAPAAAMGMRAVLKRNGLQDEHRCDTSHETIHDLCELLALPLFGTARHAGAGESPTPHDDGNEDRY